VNNDTILRAVKGVRNVAIVYAILHTANAFTIKTDVGDVITDGSPVALPDRDVRHFGASSEVID
jgi:hypothetical protein